jgi:hypothetical protein
MAEPPVSVEALHETSIWEVSVELPRVGAVI